MKKKCGLKLSWLVEVKEQGTNQIGGAIGLRVWTEVGNRESAF